MKRTKKKTLATGRGRSNQYSPRRFNRKNKSGPLVIFLSRLKRAVKVTAAAVLTVTVVGGFSFALVFGYNELIHAKYFEVKKVVLRGLNRVSQEEVLQLTGLQDRPANILAVRLRDMAQRLHAHPWVDQVSITREIPDTIIVEVTERRARALLDLGPLYFLDESGKPFKKAEETDASDLPVIVGFSKYDFLKRSDIVEGALVEIFQLMDVLERRNDRFRLGNIARVEFDRVRGITVFTRENLLVKVGFGEYDAKFKRLGRVLAHLKMKGLHQGLVYVNLECGPRVVIRRV